MQYSMNNNNTCSNTADNGAYTSAAFSAHMIIWDIAVAMSFILSVLWLRSIFSVVSLLIISLLILVVYVVKNNSINYLAEKPV